ncbi:hypothetical protein [Burkholderia ubonensis]|uniref:hypothetical protein n=1 Tax=Burkholderia ubonensis TaxID=101571 RepID=UPI0012F78B13|nr:hypothetical protein [Burkholderia ubonensis]
MSNMLMKRRIGHAESTPWRERRRQPGRTPPDIRKRRRKWRGFRANRASIKNGSSAIFRNGRPGTSGMPRIFRNLRACMSGNDCAARHPESNIAPGNSGGIQEDCGMENG